MDAEMASIVTDVITVTDMTESTNQEHQELGCRIYTFIVYVGIYGTMCVLGLIGNTLSFIVLHFDRQSHAATFLLQVMAAVDNLFLIISGASQIFTAIVLYRGQIPLEHPFNPYMQTFAWPLVHTAQLFTVYVTVLIASNRYIAICHPYSAERLCSLRIVRIQVIVLFVGVFIYNLPRFFEYDFPCAEVTLPVNTSSLVNTAQNQTQTVLVCGESYLKQSHLYRLVYENALYLLVVYLGPLVAIVFFNVRLIHELISNHLDRRQSSGSMATSNHADDMKERYNITLVMFVIIVVFLVTQTPAYINQLLYYFMADSDYHCGRPYFYYFHVSNLFVSSNSSLNFVVYCVCRRNFRERLWSLRCSRQRGCYTVHRDSFSTATVKSDNNVVIVKNASNATAYSHLTAKGSSSQLNHLLPPEPLIPKQLHLQQPICDNCFPNAFQNDVIH